MTEDNAMFHITLITVGKLKERYYAASSNTPVVLRSRRPTG